MGLLVLHEHLQSRLRHIESVLGWGRGRALRLAGVMVIVVSLLIPVLTELYQQQMYYLDASTIRLVGKANKNLVKKFSYDAQQSVWQFNKAGIKPDLSSLNNPADVAARLKAQVGGGGKEDTSLYSVDLPSDATKGVTYYDNNTNLSFSLVPQFKVSDGQERDGRLVYPFHDGGKLIYTAKNNGMKEDIVLSHNIGDELQFSYKLNLPKTLEAKLLNNGALGIYSADPALFGNITYGSDVDQVKIERARQTAAKDHLLFALPAPVIKQTSPHPNTATAHFSLQDNQLTVSASGLSQLSYPLTIDPSVVVTSTSDFATGNNEGNIDFNTSQISRGGVTGGSVSEWHYTHNSTDDGTTFVDGFSTARARERTIAYNNYLYIIGGYDGTNIFDTVQYAHINANGTIGSWAPTISLPVPLRDFGGLVYNGYMYVVGGVDNTGTTSAVRYAHINANGTIGSWTSATSLGAANYSPEAVAYNGYMYVLGGYSGTYSNAVTYTPINGNGTLGSWTSTQSFSTARREFAATAYNGYMYILGGDNGSLLNTVEYAAINSDGTLSSWASTTALAAARYTHFSGVYNGYMYIFGGYGGGYRSDVQYAKINANGTLGDWATTSSLIAGRQDIGGAIYGGYIYATGGYDMAYHNDVQYTKIDPAGVTGAYVATTSIPSESKKIGKNTCTFNGRLGAASVAYNGYLYILGGVTAGQGSGCAVNDYMSSVIYAPISPDGSLGTWSTTASFANPRSDLSAVVSNGVLYILGGKDQSSNYADVQYAATNSDGSLDPWAATTPFNTARHDHAAAVYNGYIYILGGSGATPNMPDVQYAAISSTGTVGTWNTTANLTSGRDGLAAIVIGKYLYAIAGNDGSDLDSVQYAAINSDGTIGSWMSTTHLLAPRYFASVSFYNGYIYVTGGKYYDGFSTLSYNDVQYAQVLSDGTVGPWSTTTPLTSARTQHNAIAYNGYIYIAGGVDFGMGNLANRDVHYAPINSGGSGTTGSWVTNTTDLSLAYSNGWAYGQTFADNGYLYIVGGYTTLAQNAVWYAPLNPDGSVGSWTATSSMTAPRYNFGLEIYDGYVYAIAGQTTGNGYLNSVEYAPISPTGGVGTWVDSGKPITNAARGNLSTAVYNGYLYALGGQNGSTFYSDSQYSKINNDGTIGTWAPTISFSGARSAHRSVAYNGYIYVLGGQTSSGVQSDVQYAPLNSDGTIGTWARTADMPQARKSFSLVAANGFLYVYGGTGDLLDMKDVQYASIGGGGVISGWQYGTSFAKTYSSSAYTTYNGFIYNVGGFMNIGPGPATTRDLVYAPLNVQSRVAHYSKLIDLGATYSVSSLAYNGNLPGGLRALSVRTAGSDGVLGPSQPFDSLASGGSTCTAGTTRYVYISATLDDSLMSTYSDTPTNTANITGITVDYQQAMVSPDLRLRGGKFFSQEMLQPLDTCAT